MLLTQTRSATASYYLTDGQGSTRLLTNGSGMVTDTYAYTAFGELRQQTVTTPNAYLYTRQQVDALTGLYSLRARYYAPSMGRFLSADTWAVDVHNPMELNRYVYAVNNPVRWGDPSGLLYAEGTLNQGVLTGLTYVTAKIVAYGILGSIAALALVVVHFAKKPDLGQVDNAARQWGITGQWRKEFGKHVEKAKKEYYGRDLTWEELLEEAEKFAEENGLLDYSDDE